jgi:8-oxo-dGTP pyrophosphatase MutT (NUDIX family)
MPSLMNRTAALALSDGYEGVTHAGLAIVWEAEPGIGLVLVVQRAMDPTDDPEVQETWEFPGGGLEPGEEPLAAAFREFAQEVGCPLPQGDVVNGWRAGPEDNYQGFVYRIDGEMDCSAFVPNEEVQALAWIPLKAPRDMTLRPEMRNFDWTLLDSAVSGNREEAMTDLTTDEREELALLRRHAAARSRLNTDGVVNAAQVGNDPEYIRVDDETGETIGTAEVPDDPTDYSALFAEPIPIHGVLAPEEVPTGDKRGFAAGSMSSRPYRLPFRWAETDNGAHAGALAVGSVDRLMRKDGLIHWQGLLMNTTKADDFAGLMQFFGGRYGVSVDGDNGNIDPERTEASGVLWFDAVRASGLTAVDIPAFSEAYVAFGAHPDMPEEEDEEFAVMRASGDLVTFDRGPGWVTNPRETKRIHDYWTKKGEPGYAKVGWGTPGDFTRAKKLIGEKIAKNSPEDVKYLNQIIAQWHYDALGYWPGELGKPGNAPDTPENRRRAATHAALEPTDEADWDLVLTSSAGVRIAPPAEYFTRHPSTEALVIEEPDENGIRRTYGYAGERGVCHIGYDGRCVEMPYDPNDTFDEFHLGRTKTDEGYIKTGVITYKVEHRDAQTILTETAQQAHFDNIECAWSAVRLGVDEDGVWFSGVVLPHVPEEDIILIEATGQVSGEWKFGAMRGLQCVNIPGFPVMRSSAVIDDDGNVLALVASAHGSIESPCTPTPAERMEALRQVDAEVRFQKLREGWTD